ncbi:hypothetical protein PC9H_008997 [Pleurotus ostreatus]|uniref:Methyltransferase domain-containing protein n=3 Tax=Pleurotus ostreatus TaxID=5322 RepID=A0A067P7I0_PLEO1|nr:uncharacterized protein PC9H_008997 [Pleurotus ostreatus]KAF7426628.1 hypothetical protein PC9H_008997 [Pleurotus ostreatus]KDQ32362.1 hypothetical protein PLEOSDRAFT_1034530 [Pleurotus ostreatus PC15]
MSVVTNNFLRFKPLLLDEDSDDDDMRSTVSSLFSSPSDIDMSSGTSYTTDSNRSDSPAPSVLSMTSSMEAATFKIEYGRAINSTSDVYGLPADDEELDRLDRQHLLFIQVMGKCPRVVREYLTPAFPGDLRNVLDLGCGSGTWIMEIARDFPNCDAVGVDLVPMQSPPNRSEVDDINLGLQHFCDDFDFVHARLISSGVRTVGTIVARTLKPGGYIELMEFDFHSYNKRLQQISVPVGALKQPWWPRWLAYAETAVDQRGGTPDAANHLQEWAERHGAFDEVIYQDHWIPTAPWCMQAPWKHWGDEMREDIYAFMASGRVPESVVNELEEKATEELGGARYGTYIRLQRVIARKRQGWIAPEVVFEQERLRRQQEEEQQQQQSFQAMTI